MAEKIYGDLKVMNVKDSYLRTLVVSLILRNVELPGQPSQLLHIIANLQGVVFYKVEDILVVDAEVNVQEVGVIEDCCDDVFDDAVRSVGDADEGLAIDSGYEDAFAEDSAFVGHSGKQVTGDRFHLEKRCWNEVYIGEFIVDLLRKIAMSI